MALTDCRVCGREINPRAPENNSVRGWGVLCAECDADVEIVTNPHGRFVRAIVPGEGVQQR